MKVHLDCPVCGSELEVGVTPGEPAVMYYRDGSGYPGSGPEVELFHECLCFSNDFVDTDKLYEHVAERAIERAQGDGWDSYDGPDTLEEARGER